MAKTRKRTKRNKKFRLDRRVWIAAAVVAVAAALVVILLALHRSGETKPVDRESALCVVCVDAGHGGADQGTAWEGRLEKDDTLALALAVEEALNRRNIYCVLTRSDDTTLSLEDRVAFAETEQADLFLSIHRNSAEADVCGLEVWVSQGCSDTSMALAQRLEEALIEAGVQDSRGVRSGSQSGSGSYYVLRMTSMPAALLEMGFIQNEEDNRLFDRRMEDYAAAIAGAVEDTWKENHT